MDVEDDIESCRELCRARSDVEKGSEEDIPSLLVACRYMDLKRWYMSNVELASHVRRG